MRQNVEEGRVEKDTSFLSHFSSKQSNRKKQIRNAQHELTFDWAASVEALNMMLDVQEPSSLAHLCYYSTQGSIHAVSIYELLPEYSLRMIKEE